MIERVEFGRTGHSSSRTIFGAVALADVSQKEADEVFELLQQYGINHIDTARSYGDSEVRIGPWMKHNRKEYFLATKTLKRTKNEALLELYQSLERLQTDYVDMWQLHFLVDQTDWEIAMANDGALEAALEAREKGLVKYIGVTGHGLDAPKMHLRSLERFDFDAVLLPYNYVMLKSPQYASDLAQLLGVCAKRNIAVQTIKAIARGKKIEENNSFATWYRPLENEDSISKSVRWVLHNPQVFLNTAGDIKLLPKILKAANTEQYGTTNQEMEELITTYNMEPLFSHEQN
ncbi:MAG: aldo/keto reductase [Bacilli bacterium]